MKIGSRTIKTAIGAPIAMIIAYWMGLMFYPAAGIITILSIQNTKKRTVHLALSRLLATLLSFGIAVFLFYFFKPTPLSFGLFVLFFIPLAVKFKFQDSIVVCSVLVTHFISAGLSTKIIVNGFLLMIVGSGVGILLNTFMPVSNQPLLSKTNAIEKAIQDYLLSLSAQLLDPSLDISDTITTTLETLMIEAQKEALIYQENRLLSRTDYTDLHYIEMRQYQFETLKRMHNILIPIKHVYSQAQALNQYTKIVAANVTAHNDPKPLMQQLETLITSFKEDALPQTREEFETRASLYHYCLELEYFLLLKSHYLEKTQEASA